MNIICKPHFSCAWDEFSLSLPLLGTDTTNALADYCSEEFHITIEPGQENMQFCNNISIVNDNICEGPESFDICLESAPSGGTIIINTPGSVTIIDDDGKSSV